MERRFSLIVSSEHASNAIPDHLTNLGLTEAELMDHHAWDPGAREASIRIAGALGAPLFLGEWSRLVADLNRPPDVPEVVPEISFGLPIPMNRGLDEAARAERIARYHRPYWEAVREALRSVLARDEVALHVSIHSFTPIYQGIARPMSIGVMYDPERPLEDDLGQKIVAAVRKAGYLAEINKPYDGRAPALVTSCRAELAPERYAGIEIEINQRHLGEIETIADLLFEAIRGAVE